MNCDKQYFYKDERGILDFDAWIFHLYHFPQLPEEDVERRDSFVLSNNEN